MLLMRRFQNLGWLQFVDDGGSSVAEAGNEVGKIRLGAEINQIRIIVNILF